MNRGQRKTHKVIFNNMMFPDTVFFLGKLKWLIHIKTDPDPPPAPDGSFIYLKKISFQSHPLSWLRKKFRVGHLL